MTILRMVSASAAGNPVSTLSSLVTPSTRCATTPPKSARSMSSEYSVSLDRVVQQGGHQGGVVSMPSFGQDGRHRERVRGCTGRRTCGAGRGVFLLGHVVGVLQQGEVAVGVQLAVYRGQWFQNLLDRRRPLGRDPAGPTGVRTRRFGDCGRPPSGPMWPLRGPDSRHAPGLPGATRKSNTTPDVRSSGDGAGQSVRQGRSPAGRRAPPDRRDPPVPVPPRYRSPSHRPSRTSSLVARAVPPVASTSSMITTRWPGLIRAIRQFEHRGAVLQLVLDAMRDQRRLARVCAPAPHPGPGA